jgi:hypothetical protein
MDDADLDEASTLAVSGSYKNSGQRCTAVKRMLVHEKVAAAFTELAVVAKTQAWKFGDPGRSWSTEMGTVIDAACGHAVPAAGGRGHQPRAPVCWPGHTPRRRALRAHGDRPRAPRMTHLLNLLAAIALLVWGTHIVRTGMLRVFGENLRNVLAHSFSNRYTAALLGHGRHQPGAVQHRHLPDRFQLRRQGPGHAAAGAGGDAGRRRGHQR